MSLSNGRYLSISLILAFSAILTVISVLMPVSRPVERIIFAEDALWAISWLLIARTSFIEKRAGFPPGVMAITLAVEIYLFTHYIFIDPWPFNPWLLVNYFLWPLTSLFNLFAVWKFSRDEIKPSRFPFEVLGLILMFWFVSRSIPRELVMVYLGLFVIWVISLGFLLRLLTRPQTRGLSISGNILRFSAGLLCFYANAVVRGDELSPFLLPKILMITIVLMDVAFLVILFREKRGER